MATERDEYTIEGRVVWDERGIGEFGEPVGAYEVDGGLRSLSDVLREFMGHEVRIIVQRER
jgi:hypothetical protein